MSVYEIEKTIERIGAALTDPNTKMEAEERAGNIVNTRPPRRPRKADRELADRARELQSRDDPGPGESVAEQLEQGVEQHPCSL